MDSAYELPYPEQTGGHYNANGLRTEGKDKNGSRLMFGQSSLPCNGVVANNYKEENMLGILVEINQLKTDTGGDYFLSLLKTINKLESDMDLVELPLVCYNKQSGVIEDVLYKDEILPENSVAGLLESSMIF